MSGNRRRRSLALCGAIVCATGASLLACAQLFGVRAEPEPRALEGARAATPVRAAAATPVRASAATPAPKAATPAPVAAAATPQPTPAGSATSEAGDGTAGRCTHWAAPAGPADRPGAPVGRAGGATPGRRTSPLRVEDFWSVARPGDTLCLLPGVYDARADRIAPPRGLSGRAGAPITVRAEVDGSVLIDGGHDRARGDEKGFVPVRLRENDHFVLEGFDAANSRSVVVAVSGRRDKEGERRKGRLEREDWHPIRHVVLRRIVAWDANPRFDEYRACSADPACRADRKKKRWNANNHVIDVAIASDVLLEDVAAFGTGRKIFQVYLSERVTIRRAWGRWEGNAASHIQTFSCAYRSYDSLCENLIGTWSGERQDPSIPLERQRKTIIGMDWFKKSDRWHGRADPFDSGLRVFGSLAYLEADARYVPSNLIVFGYGKNQTLADLVAVSASRAGGHHTFNLVNCLKRVDCGWQSGLGPESAPLRASGLVSIGGSGRDVVSSDWRRGSRAARPRHAELAAAQRPDVFGPDAATAGPLCHRWVDGQRTDEPLWPWPMNERIARATERARGEATDVEAEIEALLGPIPPHCRSDGGGTTPGGESTSAFAPTPDRAG